MIESFALQLSESEKGQLQYGVPKQKHSLFVKEDQSFMSLEREVFDLSDMKVALEICEESAHADEIRHNEAKQAETFLETSRISRDEADAERTEPIKVINLNRGFETLLTSYHEINKKINEDDITSKAKLYEKRSAELSQSAKLRYAILQERRSRKNAAVQEQIQQYLQDSEKRADQIIKQNIEQHKSRNRILLTRIEEAENRRKLKLQQCRERLQCSEPMIEETKMLRTLFTSEINDARNEVFASNPDLLEIRKDFTNLFNDTLLLVKGCVEKGGMEQAEQEKFAQLFTLLQQCTQQLSALLDQLRLKEAEKEKKRQAALKLEQEKAEQKLKLEQAEKEKELATQNPESSCPALPKELMLSVSRAAYHNHIQLKALLKEYEEKKKNFVSNKSNTKLIMSINKAISVPVSNITSRSGSDIKNQINSLNSILKGENIKVNKQIVALDDDARSYACLFMAQKFVKQAESQVSSSHSAAFCLALAVIGVWTNHSSFGQLFLAQLQSRCPFVIPWYVPQLPGESEKEYNKKRGYLFNDDGIAEKQDEYLSRMTGLVRTYAALIQSPLFPGSSIHPHGVAEGWKWLARMLNLDPWPDVTATVLFDFVEVCGHVMMTSYGKQFEKLLYALCHDYFPKIEEISASGGGPLQRLQMFLKDCIKLKNVPQPDGYLSDSFWNTYHHTGVVGN